ncbi:MAG: glycosyltransferase family 2 protein, partial [Nocardioidaceae bacterium]
MPILSRAAAPATPPTLGSGDDVVADRPRRRFRPRKDIIAVLDPAWATTDASVAESTRAPEHVTQSAARDLSQHLQPGEVVAPVRGGRLAMRLHHEDKDARPLRLQKMAYHCVETMSSNGRHDGLVDLGVGWARVSDKIGPERAGQLAVAAAHESGRQRDLQPRHHDGSRKGSRIRVSWWSNGAQVLLATVGAVLLPFLALVGLYQLGIDLAAPLYWVLVAGLGVTAVTIWGECLYALDPPRLPDPPDRPAPRASAVIAAYLPNEADTILETLEVFLAQEYEGGLQVVLAYNTPTPMPVEAALHSYAQEHPGLTVVKVPDSTSKAQNVNAALRIVDGEFVGIFDADHHPMPGAFQRAWQWIASGVDVVQGHCVIRNGADSTVTKVVAVEFEQIYAVSHP